MSLEEIIDETSKDGRICPQPPVWNRLWELLPDRVQIGAGWQPPLPLILAAWNFTSDQEKRERLLLHLRWAEQHNALDTIASFLSTLTAKDWHTES